MSAPVEIVLVYQSLLGIYGDRGNAMVLLKRLQWRGIEASLTMVEPGDRVPPSGTVTYSGQAYSWHSATGAEDAASIAITLAVPSLRPRSPVRALLFAVLFWSVMGVVVGLFYRFQSLLFGDGHDLATLLMKIAFDQFVFTVVWGVPIVTIAHQWKDHGYRASAVKPLLGRSWYSRYALPMLVMNWAVWIPSPFVIYSMPPALQPHIAGLISGFWSLMCLQISARTRRPTETVPIPAA